MRMQEIFTDSASPFFKSAIPIQLDNIASSEFSKFIRGKFSESGRIIGDILMGKIFELSDAVPGDIQQMCEALWSVTESDMELGREHLNSAFQLIFGREKSSYEGVLNRLTAFQCKALVAVAREEGEHVFGIKFMKDSGIGNASSLKKALSKLEDMKIIYRMNGTCRFINPFFKIWLKTTQA